MIALLILTTGALAEYDFRLDAPSDNYVTNNSEVNFSVFLSGSEPGSTLTNVSILTGQGSNASNFREADINHSDSTLITYNFTNIFFPDGNYNWTAAVILNGTEVVPHSEIRSLTVDTIAPIVRSDLLPSGPVNRFSFRTSASDVTTEVESVDFGYQHSDDNETTWIPGTKDNNGFWVAEVSAGGLPEGNYRLSVRAKDSAGNPRVSENVASVLLDRTKPSYDFNIGVPLNSHFSFSVDADDPGSGVKNVSVGYFHPTENVYKWFNLRNPFGTYWSLQIDTADIPDGSYNLTLRIFDNAGNELNEPGVGLLVVDNTAPSVTLINPGAGNYSGNLIFTASSDDGSGVGVDRVQFGYKGSGDADFKWSSVDNAGDGWTVTTEGVNGWTSTLDTSVLDDGVYNVSVRSFDRYENKKESDVVQIVIDNTMPEVSVISPVDGGNYSGDVVFNASSNDSLSGVRLVEFGYDHGDGPVWLSVNGTKVADGYCKATLNTTVLPEGSYNLSVRSTDYAGNVNGPLKFAEVVIDNSYPDVSINSPVPGNYMGVLLLNASASDDGVGVQSVEFGYWITGGNIIPLPAAKDADGYWITTLDTAIIGDGFYHLHAVATDFAGNELASPDVEFTADNDPPDLALIAPVDGNYSGNLQFTASVNDSGTGVKNVSFGYVKSDGGDITWFSGTLIDSIWTTPFNTSLLDDGPYNLSVRSSDLAGSETVLRNQVRIVVDNLNPDVSLILPVEGYNASGNMEFLAESSDALTGVKSVDFGYRRSGTSQVTWIPAAERSIDNWHATLNTSASGFREGSYSVSVRSTDFAGNENLSEDVVDVVVDNTAPTVALETPRNGNHRGSVLLSARSSDAKSGINRVSEVKLVEFGYRRFGETAVQDWIPGEFAAGSWIARIETSSLSDGRYQLSLRSTDFAGNQHVEPDATSQGVTFDNTLPAVDLIAPVVGNYSGGLIFNASSDGGASGIKSVEFLYVKSDGTSNEDWVEGDETPRGSGYFVYELDTTGVEDGVYNVSVRSTDEALNQRTLPNRAQIKMDNTAPVINLTRPVAGDFSGRVEFVATSNDPVSGVRNLSFGYRHSDNGTVTWFDGIKRADSWTASLDTVDLPEGIYSVSVRSADFAGNEEVSLNIVQIFVDNTPPGVSLVAPVEGNYSGSLSFSASSNYEGVAVNLVEFGYDSGGAVTWFNGTEGVGGLWSGTLDTTALADGTYSLSLRITDLAKNQNVSEDLVEIIVDNTMPTVSLVEPVPGNYSGNLAFEALADDQNGIRSVSFGYAKSDEAGTVQWVNGVQDTGGSWNATFDTSGLNEGTYNLSVRGTDSAGNEDTLLNVRQIIIDTSMPEVSLISPTGGDFRGTITFNASSEDSFSGVKSVEFGYALTGGEEVTWITADKDEGVYWSATLDTTPLGDGSYKLSVRSTDYASLSKTLRDFVQIKVDNSAPQISLVSPADGGHFRGTLNFNASSDGGVSPVRFVSFGYAKTGISDVTWISAAEDADGSWIASVDTGLPAFEEGIYSISVRSADYAGNENLSENLAEIVIDNSAPDVSLLAPVDEGNYRGQLSFSASSDGGVSGVELLELGYRHSDDAQITWFNGTLLQEFLWEVELNTTPLNDGIYNLSVRSTDFAGNENLSENLAEIVIDNSAPDVSLLAPVDEGNYSGNLAFSASSDGGVSKVRLVRFGYRNSSDVNVTWFDGTDGGDGSWTATLDTALLVDGLYNLSVSSSDFAGNENELLSVVEVVIDNSAPEVSLDAPLAGNYSGNLAFSASSDGGVSSIKLVEFGYEKLGTGNVEWVDGSENEGGSWSATINTAAELEDGSYSLSVRSTDFANNERLASNVRSIVVDNTNPEVSLVAPVAGDFRVELDFNALSSDGDGVGVEIVQFGYARSGDAVTWLNGTKDTDSSWIHSLYTLEPRLPDGYYNVSVRSFDFAGNKNESLDVVEIIIDNSAPDVSLDAPVEGNYSRGLLFRASSDGNVSSVKLVEFGYALSGGAVTWFDGTDNGDGSWSERLDTAVLVDGLYNLSVRSTDFAGNENLSENLAEIVIDNSAPEVSLDAPLAGNYSGNLAFSASSDGGVSKVRLVRFGYRNSSDVNVTWFDGTDNGDGSWTATLDTALLVDGLYNLSVSSSDFAGNENELLSVVEVVIDNSLPGVSLEAPVEGNYSGNLVFRASSDDSLSEVRLVQFGYRNSSDVNVTWFDGTEGTAGYWNATLDTALLADGSYNLSVRSTDFAGNPILHENVVQILIDNVNPEVSLTAPAEGNFSGNLVFNASSDDGLSGVEFVEFGYRNSSDVNVTWFDGTEGTAGYWNATPDTALLADGSYNLSVRSTDFAGNEQLSQDVVEIVVDNTKPTVSLIEPEGGNFSGNLPFIASSDDALTLVKSVQFSYVKSDADGADVTWHSGHTFGGSVWHYTLDTVLLDDGSYNLSVRSTDFAGNQEALLNSVQVVIDNVNPEVSLIAPAEGNYSGDVLFNASANDSLVGVRNVSFGYRASVDDEVTWFEGSEGTEGYWNATLDTALLADGSYNLSVSSSDFAGNEELSEDVVEIVVDNTNPEVSLVAPVAGDFKGGLVFRALSDDSLSGVELVEFGHRLSGHSEVTWFDGADEGAGGYWNATLDTALLADGSYNLSVRSTDFAGNQNELLDFVEAVIDNSLPDVELIAPVVGNYSGELLFNASSDGGVSKVRLVEFGYVKSDGVGVVEWFNGSEGTAGYWNATLDTAFLDDGSYNLSVRSTDLAENQKTSENVVVDIVVDNTNPEVSLVAPAGGDFRLELIFSASSDDNLSGVEFVDFGYAKSDGGDVTWLNATGGGGSWVASLDTTEIDDGPYDVSVRSTDFAGNQNESLNLAGIIVDNSPPVVLLLAPASGNFTGNLDLLAQSDSGVSGIGLVQFGYSGPGDNVTWFNGSSLSQYIWEADLDTTILPDGPYNLSVRSTDLAGNENESLDVVEIIVDNVPPSISLVSPVAGNYSGDVLFNASLSDIATGITRVEFGHGQSGGDVTWFNASEGEDGHWNATLDTSALADGSYNVSVRGTDLQGNQNLSDNVVEIIIDNSAPAVSLVAPVAGNYSGELLFNASSDSGVSRVSFVEFGYRNSDAFEVTWINGSEGADGYWNVTLDTFALADGLYNLGVRSTDSAGNENELLSVVEAVIDNTQPGITLNAPVAGHYRGELLFNASSEDNVSGVSLVEFGYRRSIGVEVTWINGSEGADGSWTATFDTTGVTDGVYRLSVRSTDYADNQKLSENAVQIIVDNTLSDVHLIAPAEGHYRGELLFNASSDDGLSGVELVEFGYALPGADIAWINGTESEEPGVWGVTFDTSPLEDGVYSVSVRSTDSADNKNESLNVVEIIIDNSAPEVSLVAPVAGNYSGELLFNASSEGGVSGVELVEFGYDNGGTVTWFDGTEAADGLWNAAFDTTLLADGLYNLSVRSTDFAGNANELLSVVEAVIDNSLPDVSLDAPVMGNYSGDVLFNASTSDALSGVEIVQFGYRNSSDAEVTWFDGTEAADGSWNATFDTTLLADGLYNLSVRSTDFAGNANELLSVVEAVIDNSLPDVSLDAPVEGNYSGDVLFNASTSDALSGVEIVEFGYRRSAGVEVTWINGTEGADGSWVEWLDTSDLEDGPYNLSVRSTDFAGNQNELLNVIEIIVDNLPPSFAIVSPLSGTFRDVLVLNATADDGGTGVASVEFGYIHSDDTEITWIPATETEDGYWTATLDTNTIKDGAYVLNLRSTDVYGHEDESQNVADIVIDNRAPSVSVISPSEGNYSGELLFNASVTDTGTGVNSVEFGYVRVGSDAVKYIDGVEGPDGYWSSTLDTSTLTDGDYLMTVKAIDLYNNQNVLTAIRIIIDNSVPELSLVAPVEGNYSGELLFNASSDGGVSKVRLVEFGYVKSDGVGVVEWFNGSEGTAGYWNATLDTTELDDGSYDVSVRSTDFAGNQKLAEDAVQIVVDNTMPEVSLVAPAEGHFRGDLMFNASTNDDTSGVELVEFGYMKSGDVDFTWINGTEGEGGSWTAMLYTIEIDDGSYDVSVRSTDFAGNQKTSEEPVNVVIDNSVPELSLVAPVAGNFKGALVFNASSDGGVSKVRLVEFGYAKSEGGSVVWINGSEGEGGSWTAMLDTIEIDDGSYNLSVRSTDFAGNANELLNVVEVVIDNSVPGVSLVAPAAGNVRGRLDFSAFSSDDGVGTELVEFGYADSPYAGITWFRGDKLAVVADVEVWKYDLDTTTLEDGEYNLSLRSTDVVGNQNVSLNVVEIVVDNTLPEVSLDAPVAGNFSGSLEFLARSTDATSGVKLVEFGYAGSGESIKWIPGTEGVSGYWNATLDAGTLSDGKYVLSVRSVDFADNENELLNAVEVTLTTVQDDNTPPSVSLVAPAAGNVSSTLELVALSYDGLSGVKSVEFGYANGSDVTWLEGTESVRGRWSVSLDTTSLADGSYNLSVNSTDNANHSNVRMNVVEIVVDNVFPTVSLIAPAADSFTGNLLFNASAADEGTGVAFVEFGYGSGADVTWFNAMRDADGYWSAYLDTRLVQDGSYEVGVRSTDYAGNRLSLTDVVRISVDNTAPTVSLAAPAAGNYRGSLLLSVSSSDEQSGVKLVEFGYASPGGNVTWIDGRETVGNSGVWNVQIDTVLLDDGYYDVSVRSTDWNDNQNVMENAVRITVDNTMPEVSLVAPVAGTFSGTLKFFAESSDATSGVELVEFGYARSGTVMWVNGTEVSSGVWSYLLDITSLPAGFYDLSVRSTDSAGNQKELLNVATVVVSDEPIVDPVAPVISLVSPVAGNYSGDLYFFANSSSSVSNVNSVSFGYRRGDENVTWISGTEIEPGVWGATFDTTSLEDGLYNVSVSSVDFYETSSVSLDIVEIMVDNTEPEVSVVSPSAGSFSGVLLFNASATDTGTGVDSVEFGYSRVPGAITWLQASKGEDDHWNVSLDVSTLADGSYNLSVKATDFAGTEKVLPDFAEIMVDNLQPEIRAVSPDPGNYSGEFLFNASASDVGTDVDSVEFGYSRDGGAVTWIPAAEDGDGYWSVLFDTANIPDGSYNLSAKVVDFHDRETVSMDFAEITVDNTPPFVVLSEPSEGAYSAVVDFIARSEDRTTGVMLVEFGYRRSGDQIEWIPGVETSADMWEATLDSTGLTDASYSVSVRSTDYAGNEQLSEDVVTIVIDNFASDTEPPEVRLISPVKGIYTGDVAFNAFANDSDSGVDRVLFGYARTGSGITWIPGTEGESTVWTTALDTTRLVDGNYTISVNATDRAGHSTVLSDIVQITVANFGFDNVPPEVEIVSPVEGNYSGSLLFNASASDSENDVKSVMFGYSGGSGDVTWFNGTEGTDGYWNATLDTSMLEEGSYNVSVRATDFANNPRILPDLFEIVIDNTFPSIQLTEPAGGNFSGDSLRFEVRADDAFTGVRLVEFGYVPSGGGEVTWYAGHSDVPKVWNYTLDTTTFDDGSYNASVRSIDYAGNANVSDVIVIVIDNTEPELSLIAPVAGSFSELLFIASSADATTGVKSVEFMYDGSGITPNWHPGTEVVPGYWTASPPAADLQDGVSYKLSVRSTDFADNVNGMVDVVEATLSPGDADTAAPGVSLISSVEGTFRGLLELVALSYDSLSDVQSVTFGHSSGSGNVTWISGSRIAPGFWNASLDTASLEDGSYNLSLNSTDSEGNSNFSGNVVEVVVDNTVPEVSLVSPPAGDVSEDVLVFNASVTDASGVMSVSFGYARSGGSVTWLPATEGTDGYWTASLNTSLLVEDASYDVAVNARDSVGNEYSALSILRITLDKVAAAPRRRSSSRGGGGGGGGGGGIITTPVTTTGTTQSQYWDRLAAGSETSFRVTRSGIPVSQVVFTVTEAVTDAELTIASHTEKPSYVATGYEGIVYRYVTLSRSNIEDSLISMVTIGFSVNRTFISENNASPEDIVMFRYSDGQWNELETRSTGSDAENYYYEATSPGLSSFVISLIETPEDEIIEQPVDPVEEPVEEPVAPEEPANVSEEPEEQKPEEPVGPVLPEPVDPTRGALVAVIVVVAGLTAYLLYRRSKRRSEFVKGFVYPRNKEEKEHETHPSEKHSNATHHSKHHREK